VTANKPSPSIFETARSDPLGAGIIVCVVALVVLTSVYFMERANLIRWPELLSSPKATPRPIARPPAAWRASARVEDLISVPGFPVAYWGRPDASYGPQGADVAIQGLVIHYTDETPALRLVQYGHSSDGSRGGASYGYHFYIDAAGRVLQGAPLTRRTHHVKPRHAGVRRSTGASLDNTNSIGISLIGACRGLFYTCRSEKPTAAQLEAGAAVVKALQFRFNLRCAAVFGHGELQTDRKTFEGLTLATSVRAGCR
jgi:hypothetical protein